MVQEVKLVDMDYITKNIEFPPLTSMYVFQEVLIINLRIKFVLFK